MDDLSFSKKANISVISRFDQQVKDIVINASQVALYVFDHKKTKWIKRKVEGVCFIYKRKTSPKYGIFILNRLDTNNFIEHMTSTMEIQLQEPYILYRNTFKTVYGIWFYEKSECTAMASVFQRILTELKEKEKEDQEDGLFMKNKLESSDQNGHDSSQKPNGQPDSVRQFFAKASKEATKPLPITSSGNRCTPFQSVVHIEKAHKPDNLEGSPFSVIGNFAKPRDLIVIDPSTGREHVLKSSEHEAGVQVIENNIRSMSLSSSASYEKFPQSLPLMGDSSSCSDLPELIPPGMLLTPSDLSNVVTDGEKTLNKNLLTKTQMIQAMEYLLKNDSQFIDKLYDAYLKSSKIN